MKKQIAELLHSHFDTAFSAPDGIAKLRELILTLAMQGKLVEQNHDDPPASRLLKEIKAEKERLIAEKKIKKQAPLPPVSDDEKPYEIPESWEWVRLGEIASYIQRGKGPKYVDVSTHKVISQKCVRWHGLDLAPARFIDSESLKKYDLIRFLKVDDLLWNSTGTGTIGRACLVPEELEDIEIVADSHVTVVRVIKVNSKFLLKWIQSPIVQNVIKESASGTTNQIELKTSVITSLLFPLPPLPEQKRIVTRIDELMARCDELERLRKERDTKRLEVHTAAINKLLEHRNSTPSSEPFSFITKNFEELYSVRENVTELRKAILQLAVMGRLVPQDPNDPPASELLKEIESEKLRLARDNSNTRKKKEKKLPPVSEEEIPYKIPDSWQWVRLGEIGIFDRGRSKHRPRNDKRLFKNGIYPFVQTGDVSKSKNTNNIILTCSNYYNDFGLEQSQLWVKDTLCITIAANIAETGFLGMDACIPDSVVAFSGIDKALEKIVKVFIDVAKEDLENYAPSTAQKNINLSIINELIFPLPPLPEQKRIVTEIDRLMALCDILEEKIDGVKDTQIELLNAVMATV